MNRKKLGFIIVFNVLCCSAYGMEQTIDPWETLPIELKAHIISFIQATPNLLRVLSDLSNLRSISNEWKAIINEDFIYKVFVKRYIERNPQGAIDSLEIARRKGYLKLLNVLLEAGIKPRSVNTVPRGILHHKLKPFEEGPSYIDLNHFYFALGNIKEMENATNTSQLPSICIQLNKDDKKNITIAL
jgi:hypothetical protein